MRRTINMTLTLIALSLVVVPFAAGGTAQDDKPKRQYIEANMMGTSTQMGRMVAITITLEQFSTAEDQQVLLQAFKQGGAKGMLNAVSKMSGKGRIAIPGTIGYDLNYIREFPVEGGGRKIRFVTDRPIRMGENWADSRSRDYNLSAGEVILGADEKSSSGTIMPACEFTMKNNELTIEAFQNPWKLVNVRVRD